MTRSTIGALVVAALLLGACGSASKAVAQRSMPQPSSSSSSAPSASPNGSATSSATPVGPTSSPSQAPVQPSPTSTNNSFDILPVPGGVSATVAARISGISCSGSIGASDPVAIVQLHGATAEILRDYADPKKPRTVCQFPTYLYGITLVDAHHVVVPAEAFTYALVDLPAVRFHWFALPSGVDRFPTFLAVSPQLDRVAWLSMDVPHNTDLVHITTKSGDRVVGTLPNPHSGRCGSPEDSLPGAFSASGSNLYVLDQPFPTFNSLLVLIGDTTTVLLTPPGQFPQGGWPSGSEPAMPVWEARSDALFYRQGGDVWRWSSAYGSIKYLTGVNWYYPSVSADGRYLAYAVLRPDGLHNVYLVDLDGVASPRLIGKGTRTTPVFLNANLLWFKSEGQGICGAGGSQPLIYDLSDGTESASVIDQVSSVWPSQSSNF